jgi:hypothetical protein
VVHIAPGRLGKPAIQVGPLRLCDPGEIGKARLWPQPLDQASLGRHGLGESLLFALRACSLEFLDCQRP